MTAQTASMMTKGAKLLSRLFERPLQKDIAKELDIDESYLSYLMSGRRTPSMEVAGRIQEHLGIPVAAWIEDVSK